MFPKIPGILGNFRSHQKNAKFPKISWEISRIPGNFAYPGNSRESFRTGNIQIFFVLVYFVCHTPQFKMLVFAFQSEVWITQNFNFSVFAVFCLSLSWKYRFSQNVNCAKVQSKTKKYCKFHVDPTRQTV